MLKPKQLNEFLQKASKLFPSIKNIFIANPDGSLIASTGLTPTEHSFTSCLSNLWNDYYSIGQARGKKIQNYQKYEDAQSPAQNDSSDDEEVNSMPLKFAFIQHSKGFVILTAICKAFILGINQDSNIKLGQFYKNVRVKILDLFNSQDGIDKKLS